MTFIGITFLEIILFISLLGSIYLLVKAVKREESYEQLVKLQEEFLKRIANKVEEVDSILGNENLKEAFRGDDEVGLFFEEIESIQKDLSQYSKQIKEFTNEEEK